MSSSYLTHIRSGTFVTTLVFSLIVLSISADLVSLTHAKFYYGFSGLALATGLLTIITVGTMFLVERYRQGSFLSYVVFEIAWLSILWVLWLSSGSYAASTDQLFTQDTGWSTCNFGDSPPVGLVRACHETKAVMAFSFLTWILLMGYTIMLLALALRAQGRGRPAWRTCVRDGALLYTSERAPGSVGSTVPVTQPTLYQTYPPATQQTLPSSVPRSYPSYPRV